MPLPWIVSNLYNLARRRSQNRRGAEALDQLSEQLVRQQRGAEPTPAQQRQLDPTFQLLAGTQDAQQSGIPQGQGQDFSNLIERARAVEQARGGKAGFDYLLGQTDPAALSDQRMREQALQLQQQRQQGLMAQPTAPSSVREFKFYQGLTPQDQEAYMRIKRGSQLINTGGGGQGYLNPTTGDLEQIVSAEDYGQAAGVSESRSKDIQRRYTEQVALPDLKSQADRSVRLIDQALAHPGLNAAYGLTSYVPARRGSDRAGFEAIRGQILGGAFLEAVESLKGAGPITEVEGAKATSAITRLSDEKISAPEARKAMRELRKAVRDGFAKLQRQASTAYTEKGPVQPKRDYDLEYVPGEGFK